MVETQIRGALTKDFPLYIQRNRLLATSLSIFRWCRMLRMRFNKVAQSVSSLVSLQSFHIVSKSERKVWGIVAEREIWWRERDPKACFYPLLSAQSPADNTVDLKILLSWIQEFLHISQWNLLDIVHGLWPDSGNVVHQCQQHINQRPIEFIINAGLSNCFLCKNYTKINGQKSSNC